MSSSPFVVKLEADWQGLEAWNMPTQNGTQNTIQNQSQMLFRDESMQVETASTMMALESHETQTSDSKSIVFGFTSHV
jgi:hypothetical protein